LPPHFELQLDEALLADPVVALTVFMTVRGRIPFVKDPGTVKFSELRPTARAVVMIPIVARALSI
jgi:hypothetical protein